MQKYAKLRDNDLTLAPRNKGNIINYNLNIEAMKADGYKPFIAAEREAGKEYKISYKETETQIKEIAEEIKSDLEAEENAKKEQRIQEIKQELDAIDLKSIRVLREGNSERLEFLEQQAQALRDELKQITERT